jgi:hypothetical protein
LTEVSETDAGTRIIDVMRDTRFEQLLAAWRAAEDAFESYAAQRSRCNDAAVKRVLTQQLQGVAWRKYGVLCNYVASCRKKLPRL